MIEHVEHGFVLIRVVNMDLKYTFSYFSNESLLLCCLCWTKYFDQKEKIKQNGKG